MRQGWPCWDLVCSGTRWKTYWAQSNWPWGPLRVLSSLGPRSPRRLSLAQLTQTSGCPSLLGLTLPCFCPEAATPIWEAIEWEGWGCSGDKTVSSTACARQTSPWLKARAENSPRHQPCPAPSLCPPPTKLQVVQSEQGGVGAGGRRGRSPCGLRHLPRFSLLGLAQGAWPLDVCSCSFLLLPLPPSLPSSFFCQRFLSACQALGWDGHWEEMMECFRHGGDRVLDQQRGQGRRSACRLQLQEGRAPSPPLFRSPSLAPPALPSSFPSHSSLQPSLEHCLGAGRTDQIAIACGILEHGWRISKQRFESCVWQNCLGGLLPHLLLPQFLQL